MTDLLVLGSGVAGLSAAVRARLHHRMDVTLVTKGATDMATTRWAQGGVAAALSGTPVDIESHVDDTLRAGAGLCDRDAVQVLVEEGPVRLRELIDLGAHFDTDEHGDLELAREGGHSVARVVHAGGAATGAEIERALVAASMSCGLTIREDCFATDLIVRDGRCVGIRAIDESGEAVELYAHHVLLATGGAGQLYSVTTNPPVATGDGVAMALRAGVATADLEFFQFHPTALHHPAMPRPLLTEAIRGEGAKLRDMSGDRFIDELLPRDIVSQAIHAKLIEEGGHHVWLDATGIDDFAGHFPTIAAVLDEVGLDPSRDWLPVSPAAHHQCGGVVTDLHGATSLWGLWAAGETSCTGVHGANRLASNSLLEGMVFGPRVVEAIASGVDHAEPTGVMGTILGDEASWLKIEPILNTIISEGPNAEVAERSDDQIARLRDKLQKAMFHHAGVQRDADSLDEAARVIRRVTVQMGDPDHLSVAGLELRNLCQIGWVLVNAAKVRTESRGTHSRSDFPGLDPDLAHRFFV